MMSILAAKLIVPLNDGVLAGACPVFKCRSKENALAALAVIVRYRVSAERHTADREDQRCGDYQGDSPSAAHLAESPLRVMSPILAQVVKAVR
jgi:hypothetical protein